MIKKKDEEHKLKVKREEFKSDLVSDLTSQLKRLSKLEESKNIE